MATQTQLDQKALEQVLAAANEFDETLLEIVDWEADAARGVGERQTFQSELVPATDALMWNLSDFSYSLVLLAMRYEMPVSTKLLAAAERYKRMLEEMRRAAPLADLQ